MNHLDIVLRYHLQKNLMVWYDAILPDYAYQVFRLKFISKFRDRDGISNGRLQPLAFDFSLRAPDMYLLATILPG